MDFFLTERGGTPPPPSRTAGSKKPNGKKLTERGGTPPPSRTISVTGVFETFPKVAVNLILGLIWTFGTTRSHNYEIAIAISMKSGPTKQHSSPLERVATTVKCRHLNCNLDAKQL